MGSHNSVCKMRGLWCVALVVSVVYINLASSEESCPRLEKVGCFHDSFKRTNADRVFPNELINRRDPMSNNWDRHTISWKAYPQSIKSLACACAKAAKAKGWKYFGLQFFGECWSGPSLNPARDGPSDKCIGTNYKPCIDNDPTRQCVGKAFTNYVYKIKPDITYHHPIDGRWAGWSSWSACSKLCNNGTRTRTRTCTNPRPLHGGHQCPGKATDEEGCNQEPCEPKCNSQMDIGIILDASTSVTRKNWEGTLKFVNRLSKIFTIGPDHVKFGIIRFSWFPYMIFGLSNKQYWTNAAFENKVSRIRYTYGGTRTDRALEMAEKQLLCETCGTRKAAHKALLVVTDGIPSINSAPLDEVTQGLKKDGVTIVAVGVGNVDYDVLNKIATDANHVITLGGYAYIDDPINKLVKLLCKRV